MSRLERRACMFNLVCIELEPITRTSQWPMDVFQVVILLIHLTRIEDFDHYFGEVRIARVASFERYHERVRLLDVLKAGLRIQTNWKRDQYIHDVKTHRNGKTFQDNRTRARQIAQKDESAFLILLCCVALRRFLKSFAIGSEELFCPRTSVDSASSVTNDTLATLTGMEPACGRDYDLCSDDLDCGPGLMCCPSGCIYKCVVPEAPKAAVATDWLEEPEALTVGGNSWLIEDGSSSNPSQHEIECSTSVFPGIEPLNCMSGYTCSIQTPEDVQHQIPNRGICIRTALPDASKPLGPLFDPLSYGGEVEATKEAPCLLNGKEVPHGYHDTVDCNLWLVYVYYRIHYPQIVYY
eukprot:gene14523-16029_t